MRWVCRRSETRTHRRLPPQEDKVTEQTIPQSSPVGEKMAAALAAQSARTGRWELVEQLAVADRREARTAVPEWLHPDEVRAQTALASLLHAFGQAAEPESAGARALEAWKLSERLGWHGVACLERRRAAPGVDTCVKIFTDRADEAMSTTRMDIAAALRAGDLTGLCGATGQIGEIAQALETFPHRGVDESESIRQMRTECWSAGSRWDQHRETDPTVRRGADTEGNSTRLDAFRLLSINRTDLETARDELAHAAFSMMPDPDAFQGLGYGARSVRPTRGGDLWIQPVLCWDNEVDEQTVRRNREALNYGIRQLTAIWPSVTPQEFEEAYREAEARRAQREAAGREGK